MYYYYVLLLCIATMYYYYILLLCITTMYYYYILLLCITTSICFMSQEIAETTVLVKQTDSSSYLVPNVDVTAATVKRKPTH